MFKLIVVFFRNLIHYFRHSQKTSTVYFTFKICTAQDNSKNTVTDPAVHASVVNADVLDDPVATVVDVVAVGTFVVHV